MNGQYGISVAKAGAGGSGGSGTRQLSKTIVFDNSTGNELITNILSAGDIITGITVAKIGANWTPDTATPTYQINLENVGNLLDAGETVEDLNDAGFIEYQVYGVVQNNGDELNLVITNTIETGTAKIIVNYIRP
jgi:hypothetical protein